MIELSRHVVVYEVVTFVIVTETKGADALVLDEALDVLLNGA